MRGKYELSRPNGKKEILEKYEVTRHEAGIMYRLNFKYNMTLDETYTEILLRRQRDDERKKELEEIFGTTEGYKKEQENYDARPNKKAKW